MALKNVMLYIDSRNLLGFFSSEQDNDVKKVGVYKMLLSLRKDD